MSWSEVFDLFLICHLTGDFLLQTEFQAINKHGGLGRNPVKRRALVQHVGSYGLPFLPAFAYIGFQETAWAWLALPVLLLTHLVQDDGRALARYVHRVKKTDAPPGGGLWIAVDQSFHIVALFAFALLVTA